MVKRGKTKTIIRLMLIIVSLIGMLVCAALSLIFYIRHPDMTELRRLIEFPYPTVGALVCLILLFISRYMKN